MSKLPGVKHKVIGLVSGGKDSCFNLMHCVANGHEIVALATLTPEPGIDELDSHLYQSVGTHLLPLLAQSMSLPLYTKVIRGKAISQGPEYGSRLRLGAGTGQKGDETEDLTCLLSDVLEAHPEATALSSGAILSTYQRLRIEHVCGRLGLTSLSFLWQSEQSGLLDWMLSSGVEAVIMKVAGVGLGVEVVGKQLGQIRPLLAKLEAQYGSHPAGEGGEYETLTLSTPLFSHRLKLVKTKTIVTDPEPYTVAYLKVEEAVLEPKEGWVKPTMEELREMLGLEREEEEGMEGLDEEGKERLEELGERDVEEGGGVEIQEWSGGEVDGGEAQFVKRKRWFTASVQGVTLPSEDVSQELEKCFNAISSKLESENLSLPLHSTHITLLLSSMSLFLPANEKYKTYFGTSPPSRATVAVPLSSGRVRVEVVGFDDTPLPSRPSPSSSDGKGRGSIGNRSALHVQGQSYWAPANIGPYSQAVLVASRLHLAGQIPFIPASLTLPRAPASPKSPYPHQATLALQHVGRIVQALKSRNATGGGWEGWVEGGMGWWAKCGGGEGEGQRESGEGVQVTRDAWRIWTRRNGGERAPIAFVQAKELPKGALVEYQVNLHTGRRDYTIQDAKEDEEGDDDDGEEELEPVYESGKGQGVWWESCHTSGRVQGGSRGLVFVKDVDALAHLSKHLQADPKLGCLLSKAVSIRVYHLAHLDPARLSSAVSSLGGVCTLVPVFSVHDRDGESVQAALEVFGV
ncbi:cytoplasmic protein [Cryptococcus neoformans MW-RSA852]|nr:cytoplasmic protein [Cryptococcus neoformans var. grubii MW-RSA852]